MLLGRMPGDAPGYPFLNAALPPYATLIAQYLNRFGPYRLQPYGPPRMPAIAVAAPPTLPVPVPVATATTARNWTDRPSPGAPDRNSLREQDPVGRGLGVLSGLHRPDAIDRINAARRAGLINDANRHVGAGAAIGRAGGVGTPGVSGGFARDSGGDVAQGAKARGQMNAGGRASASGSGADKNTSRGASARGSAQHSRSGRRPQ